MTDGKRKGTIQSDGRALETMWEYGERYRLLFENAPLGVVTCDRSGYVTSINQKMLEMLGAQSGDFAMSTNLISFPLLINTGIAGDIATCLSRGESVTNERYYTSHWNKSGYMRYNMAPLRDTAGVVSGMLAIVEDVTGRKEAEQALKASETFLNNVFDSIQDGISVLDKDLNIVRTNHVMEEWHQYIMPLCGKKCYHVYHGRSVPCDICPSLKAIRQKTMQSEIVPFHGENEVVKGWLEIYSFPLLDAGGNVTGVIEHVRDITERKRAEDSLRESEEKFRALTETVSAAICILQDGRFQYINPAMETISGYTGEELMSVDFRSLVHPDSIDYIKARYISWLAGSSDQARGEFKGVDRNGSVRWVDISRKTIAYDGRPAILITGIDITERKLVEEALQHSEERYRQLTESSADFIYIIDRGFRVRFVNRSGAVALRMDQKDVIGAHLESLFPPESYSSMKEGLSKVFESGKPYSSEMVHKFYQGNFYMHVALTPLFDGEGNVSYVMGVSRDINDLKRAEAALRESEEKFRVLAETSPTAICVFRGEQFVYVNPAGERISGYAMEDFLRMKILDFPTPDCREKLKKQAEAIERGNPVPSHLEISFCHKNREVRWVDVTIGPVNIGGVPAYIASAYDVTERRRVGKELLEAKSQAELYLDLMGHDINNMHQMALGYLEIARDAQAEESQKMLLDKPIDALQRSARLIRNVRKLQRLREGTINAQMIDLCTLLSDLGREYDAPPDKTVRVSLNDHSRCYVRANELLYDVFANLAGNAIKHTEGHASITISLDSRKEADRLFYVVSVEDDGTGIPDDLKDRIFNRLLKGTARADGSGIGLYLVKSLVDSYRGRVWVEDRVPGDYTKGAKFVVMLPATEALPEK